MRKIRGFMKVHCFSLIVLGVTVAVSVFIGVLVGRMVEVNPSKEREAPHDTMFVSPSVADSLLQDISIQVKEINSKIPAKRRTSRKAVKKNDTIKVEATIHLDKNEVSVGE